MSKSVQKPEVPALEGPPSVEIVEAVAAARGSDSVDVEPLYGLFDLEAIDQLVENSRGEVRIELTVDGVDVTVRGDGVVEIR